MKAACITYRDRITDFINTAQPTNDTLFGGELALSFYYYYLYESTLDETYADIAIEKLEKVLVAFNNDEARLHGSYYCNGISGLFYLLVLFMKKGFLGDDMREEVKLLGEQLLNAALDGIEGDYNDFAHGTFGTFHSLILYAESFNDHRLLVPFLQKIDQKYLQSDSAWITSYIIKNTEKMTVNFSFAHGQPSLLMLLMRAYKLTGISPDTARLLRRNIDYVIGFRSEEPIGDTCNYFPSMVHPETLEHNTSKRLAWCYSDLGQVFLLYRAASFFKDDSYLQIAQDAGLKTTLRNNYETTLLNSAQVCHGTGGVAQMYYTLWKETNTAAYKTAGDYWIGQTLTYLEKELKDEISNTSRCDIIEGLPGIGLVLMSYITNNETDWSNLILL